MFKKGDKLFIRTVTYHLVGEVVKHYTNPDGWVKLKDASWVADSGRFSIALETGRLNEVEVVGEVNVNLATATDIYPWNHDLPTVSI